MEEAPCPVFVGETPKPFYDEAYDEKDKTISESKKVEVEFNNNKYILELGKSENNKNIIFKISLKKSHNLSKFTAYINFNQFNDINSIFSFYTNLNEIYKLLIKNLNEKKFAISLKSDKFVITFNFLMPGDKVVNVDFYLKEEKTSGTMALNDVYSIVDKLEEENNKFKEEINLLKNEDKKLKDELDNKSNEIINLKNEVNQIKKENEFIKEKMKFFEEKLNDISNNNIIINDNDNVKIKQEKINLDNNIENNNKDKNEININQKPKLEYDSIPNNYSDININNINRSQNNIQKNIIIDEDEEEEKPKSKSKENNNKTESKTYISNINNIKEDNKTNSRKVKSVKQTKKIPNIENVNFDNLFTDSKIISSKKEKQALYNWLSIKGGNIKEIKLIFQSSQDGDEYDTFFSKCGEKGPTLSLIKSKNDKKFGGFTKANWTDKNGKIKIKDESAFIYSLNKLKKYDVLNSDIAIACYPSDYLLMYGNNFDRYGLRIYSGFLEKGNYENFKNKSYDTNDQFCLSGENEFYVDELEVFLIVFE